MCTLIAALGLVAALVLLLKPVDASFEEDPLLRLQGFDRPPGSLPTEVNCGSLPASLKGTAAAASLYTIARDEACHREGYRRLVAAIAASSAVVVLTLVVVVAAQGTNGLLLPRPAGTSRAEMGRRRPEWPAGATEPEPPRAEVAEAKADAAPSDGAEADRPQEEAGETRERGAYGLGGPQAPARSTRRGKNSAEAPAVTPGDADR